MSTINPVNPGNKSIKALSSHSMPELFDLRNKLFMRKLQNSDTMRDSIQLSKLFRNDPFMAGEGLLKTYTEKDTQTYGTAQPEGTTGQLVKFGIGRTMDFSFTDYGNTTTLTGKARKYNRYPELLKTIDIPMMLHNRRVLDGTHLFTFAFDASMVNADGATVDLTVIDGLSLINANHTTAQTGATFTNVITGNPAFSKAGLLAGETVLRDNTIDGYGALGSVSPNVIVTSTDPTVMYNVRQITGSSTEVGQTNSAVINALQKYEHIALTKLDTDAKGARVAAKSDMWFIVDKSLLEAVYCEAVAISNSMPVEDELKGYPDSHDVVFPSMGSWVYKFITPMGIAGSNPA